jgi:hypothetical protein
LARLGNIMRLFTSIDNPVILGIISPKNGRVDGPL